MKLPKTILRGYDKVTMRIVAKALGIPMPKRKGGEGKRMKIPMAALMKGKVKDEKEKPKSKKGMKFGAMKGKKAKNDNDGDEY